MIDTNQQLSAMLYAISALEPESETLEAQVSYFRELAGRWFQVAGLMAAESAAADELLAKYRWALEDAGIDPLRVVN